MLYGTIIAQTKQINSFLWKTFKKVNLSWCGGIGIHTGLKILRFIHMGSNPITSTNREYKINSIFILQLTSD